MLRPPTAPPPDLPWRRVGPLVFATLLLAALPSLPLGVNNWDNQVKLQLARNVLAGQGLTLPGPTPDDAQYVLVGRDGARYTGYPPLAAAPQLVVLASGPLLGGDCEGAGALLLLALTAWAVVAWGRAAGVPPAAAAAGALLATAGTALWPMAAHGYDVLVEALALALILRAGTGPGEGRGRAWVGAGLALGAAFAVRFGAAALAVSAGVLVLGQCPRGLAPAARRAALFALGCLPGIALVAWFNFHRFGSLTTVYQPTALGSLEALTVPWFSSLHLQGVAGLLVSPGKGLIWYAPPVLAAVAVAVPLARRLGAPAAALGAQLLASALLFGRFRYWHGDWAWGPRYVAPLCLAAAPLAWLAWERARAGPRWARPAALGALGLAVALQALPVVVQPVGAHFFHTVGPLAQAGRLATRPFTRPPVPEDNGVLYFRPDTSGIASVATNLRARLDWPASARALARALARAALVPLTALALAWYLSRRAPRPAVPAGEGAG